MFTSLWFDTFRASLNQDLLRFLPELILCSTIVLMLFFRLFPFFNRFHMGPFAMGAALLALLCSVEQFERPPEPVWLESVLGFDFLGFLAFDNRTYLFSGLLAFDNLAIFMRV